jgi:hypothetical protein
VSIAAGAAIAIGVVVLGDGLGAHRPPDDAEQRDDRDLQHHRQPEDRPEAVHGWMVPGPGGAEQPGGSSGAGVPGERAQLVRLRG